MVQREDDSTPILTETPAESEFQLQTIIKDTPDLLPIDEFGMTGPLLVVGRETTLPFGFIDLFCLARGGEPLLVEFKTGPQNADFRSVLAQLLDYGSDLWRLSYEELESLVPLTFFKSKHCLDPRLQGRTSVADAAKAIWPDMTDEEFVLFRDRLTQYLSEGAFHYVAVAQRFTPIMERTVEYLNAMMPVARFYAVELVRFAADTLSAFESRTVLKPPAQNAGAKQTALTTEVLFLESITDASYREALRELLDACRALKLRLEAGSKGISLRLPTPDRPEPLTIGWIFPPDVTGWYGLTDFTLGYDPASAVKTPSALPALDQYLLKVAALPTTSPVKPQGLKAYRINPEGVVASRHLVTEMLTALVQQVGTKG